LGSIAVDRQDFSDVGVVAIGRNEGERLHRCMASVAQIAARVYVDSGSSDGSAQWTQAQGIDVVALPNPPKFTAARARNAGLDRLSQSFPDLAFVQMIDGDCELQPGWLASARDVLMADSQLAGVFGRLRERFPTRSIYNAMCDEEWDAPIGEAYGFGGIVLLRLAALRKAGGYNPAIIAAEDTELSRRLRDAGWKIERIDQEMALHDAAITRFWQWWRRTMRSGHAFAELAQRHPRSTWPDWVRACHSIAFWGGAVPAAALIGLIGAIAGWPPAILLPLLLVPLWTYKLRQITLAKLRHGQAAGYAWRAAGYLMLGKIAQLLGLATYHRNRLLARQSQIIEYKGPGGS
jgi:GT2 family glycosyltransferase